MELDGIEEHLAHGRDYAQQWYDLSQVEVELTELLASRSLEHFWEESFTQASVYICLNTIISLVPSLHGLHSLTSLASIACMASPEHWLALLVIDIRSFPIILFVSLALGKLVKQSVTTGVSNLPHCTFGPLRRGLPRNKSRHYHKDHSSSLFGNDY